MTYPYEYDDTDQDVPESQYEGLQTRPVKVEFEETQQVAPEFGALATWPVTQAGSSQPTQLCPHRYHRYKCKFAVTIPANTVLYLATKPDPLNSLTPGATANSGFLFSLVAGQSIPDWEGQQPLYAVFTGTGPVSVAVMDMSYGKVQ